MPRKRIHYSRIAHDFPTDLPPRLERFQAESGLSWGEIARRQGTYINTPKGSLAQRSGRLRRQRARAAAGEGGGKMETTDMPRSRRPARVLLNAAAVWELLDRLDLSQNELARRCGISRGYMTRLMRGERSPSPGLRRRMQEVLGVDDFHVLFIIVEEEDDG